MIAIIQRNQIRYFKNEQVGEELTDRLQLDISFPEYPDLPTYGISVDVTGITTQAELRALLTTELKGLQTRVQAQIQDNEIARDYFDVWGWSDTEFEIDNL